MSAVERLCYFPGCSRPYQAKGLCATHYRRASRGADQKRWLPRKVRAAVLKRDGWVCQLCSKPITEDGRIRGPGSPSIDHILPRALGGSDDVENLQAAHLGCNARKHTRVEVAA